MKNIVALGLVAMLAGCASDTATSAHFQSPLNTINAVILSDGSKIYTAGGLAAGEEAQVRQELVAAIERRCGSPAKVTHWQAWDRSGPLKDWTEFEINARCT